MTFLKDDNGTAGETYSEVLAEVASLSRVFRVQRYWNAAHSDYDAAIEAASAAAHAAGGGMVWFDGDADSIYQVSGFSITSKNNLTFSGNGATLQRRAGLVSPDTTNFGTFYTCDNLKINGLKWDNNNLERYGGLSMYGCTNVWVWSNRFFDSNLHDAWRDYDHFGLIWLYQEGTANPGRGLHFWENICEDIEMIEVDYCQEVDIHDNISRRAAGTCPIGCFFLNDATNALIPVLNVSIHHNLVIDPRKRGITFQAENTGPNNATIRDMSFNDNTVEYRVATVGSGTTTNSSTSVTGVTGTFAVGQYIYGTNIPAGAWITAVGAGTLTISSNATGSGSVTLTSSYAGSSTLLDFTTVNATTTGNNYSSIRIENNTIWVDPLFPAGVRTSPHLRVRHNTNQVWSNVTIRGNKVTANTSDWAIEAKQITNGCIENNEVYGSSAFGMNFAGLTGCKVVNNRASATTSAFQFTSSGGGNVIGANRALGTPTNVWAAGSAVVATDILMATAGAKSVVAAATLTLPLDAGDVVTITGNTNITAITATGLAGRVFTFIFTGTPTLTDGSNIKIGGNFVAAGTTNDPDGFTVACDGTNFYASGAGSAN